MRYVITYLNITKEKILSLHYRYFEIWTLVFRFHWNGILLIANDLLLYLFKWHMFSGYLTVILYVFKGDINSSNTQSFWVFKIQHGSIISDIFWENVMQVLMSNMCQTHGYLTYFELSKLPISCFLGSLA